MPTPDQVMDAYLAMWNEPEEAERRRLAEQTLTEDGIIMYPSVQARGWHDIVAGIGLIQHRIPNIRFVPTSGREQHHGWLRATWRMLQGDGSVLLDGVDIAELADDGRLLRVIGFHDPLPALTEGNR
jgi:hypothetical protein